MCYAGRRENQKSFRRCLKLIRGVRLKPEKAAEFSQIFSSEKVDSVTHGNTKYPELHDREALEALVSRYGTPARIAQALGCRRQLADAAMRRFGIKVKRYALSDERRRSLRMRE